MNVCLAHNLLVAHFDGLCQLFLILNYSLFSLFVVVNTYLKNPHYIILYARLYSSDIEIKQGRRGGGV